MKAQQQQQQPTPVKRRSRGRPFQNGNPGRRPGSLNRSTMLAQAITEADKRELVQIGLARAKAGDSQMLKFFLERIIPKEPSLTIDLPAIKNHSDLADAHSALMKAVSTGEIGPAAASLFAGMLKSISQFLPDLDAEFRIRTMEKQLEEVQRQYDPARS